MFALRACPTAAYCRLPASALPRKEPLWAQGPVKLVAVAASVSPLGGGQSRRLVTVRIISLISSA
jgi:hypothetical protein